MPNRLQTKEEQHDAHSVGKIVKQPVRNATPYFEMGLISTVYNACVGEQFEEMAAHPDFSVADLHRPCMTA